MLAVVALLVLAVSTPAFSYTENPLFHAFLQWSSKHGKVYAAEEVNNRFTNWQNSLEIINKNNEEVRSTGKGALFALNKFSDLTPEEFRAQHLRTDFLPTPEEKREYFAKPSITAPTSWNWVTKGKTTKVKNQGQCGSCWAFSATENIESVWMIGKKIDNSTMPPLSPQQIVDCDGVDGGCNGGDTPTAYKYVIRAGGMETEKDYPYRAVDERCHFEKAKVVAHIAGFKYATSHHDEKTLIDSIAAVSPLSICVDAEKWQYYDKGVMTAAQCAKHVTLDHCVQITGYDLGARSPYYMVRNSWGEDWGERGFIRLEYGHNTCGITDEATSAHL